MTKTYTFFLKVGTALENHMLKTSSRNLNQQKSVGFSDIPAVVQRLRTGIFGFSSFEVACTFGSSAAMEELLRQRLVTDVSRGLQMATLLDFFLRFLCWVQSQEF